MITLLNFLCQNSWLWSLGDKMQTQKGTWKGYWKIKRYAYFDIKNFELQKVCVNTYYVGKKPGMDFNIFSSKIYLFLWKDFFVWKVEQRRFREKSPTHWLTPQGPEELELDQVEVRNQEFHPGPSWDSRPSFAALPGALSGSGIVNQHLNEHCDWECGHQKQ